MEYIYLIFNGFLTFLSIEIVSGVSFLWFFIAIAVFVFILRLF